MLFSDIRMIQVTFALVTCGNVTAAAEKDVFAYDVQRADRTTKKIVFIGDAGTHGEPGNHEFMAGSMLLARQLNAHYSDAFAVVRSSQNWPPDLRQADSIIVALNHGGQAALDPQIFAAVRRGAGFMAVHFGVEVESGSQADNYLRWLGGYYEKGWSVNPWWTPNFRSFPEHPVTRGVRPFSVRDEWYYHIRFVADMEGVTPILTDLPPLETVNQKTSSAEGNAIAYRKVAGGERQHMAWAYERSDGGRGFGFTGLHLHKNLKNDSFRRVLLNAVAWVTHLEIPENGVTSVTPSDEVLAALMAEARSAIKAGK